MLSKLPLSLLLAVSLSCFGQVVSTGGYATTAGPAIIPISAASAPLVATPDVALPGSGPAVGSPLGSSNANDPRVSTGPSVYNPNAAAVAPGEAPNTTPTSQAAANSNGLPSGNNEAFEFGVQQVIVESPGAIGSAPSLGEIARDLRAHRRPATKMINNDTVARFNAKEGGIGNLTQPNTSTVAGNAQPSNSSAPASIGATVLMAQNQTPALPQSDQSEAAEPPQSAAQPSATASQQRHVSPSQSSTPATSQSSTSAEQNPTPAASQGSSGKLPQTASHLPFILFLGGLGVAGGTLYLLRR